MRLFLERDLAINCSSFVNLHTYQQGTRPKRAPWASNGSMCSFISYQRSLWVIVSKWGSAKDCRRRERTSASHQPEHDLSHQSCAPRTTSPGLVSAEGAGCFTYSPAAAAGVWPMRCSVRTHSRACPRSTNPSNKLPPCRQAGEQTLSPSSVNFGLEHFRAENSLR